MVEKLEGYYKYNLTLYLKLSFPIQVQKVESEKKSLVRFLT